MQKSTKFKIGANKILHACLPLKGLSHEIDFDNIAKNLKM
jgi:hypothetical protein